MADKAKTTTSRKSKVFTSQWQQSWMTHVLSNGYNSFAKLLFMRIASFGERGCWMNNETIADEFNRSERTVRRAVSALWLQDDIIITGWNGHGRKMYAKQHPRVTEELNRGYYEAMKKGKVESIPEYHKKIRLRLQPSDNQN